MIRRILVLQTLPRPLVFSPNNALITLARHLDRRRYEMTVAVPRLGLLTEALAAEGVQVIRVPGLKTYRRHDAIWRLPVVSLRIAAAARKHRIHLLLANHAELGPFAHTVSRLCTLPWICFLRQADRSHRYYEKYRVAQADAVGAVSEAALEGFRAHLRDSDFPARSMTAVPTGIDLPNLTGAPGTPASMPPGWSSTSRIVGTVGLRDVKRPEILLEVLSRLVGEVPDARCLFVGALEASRRERLETLARDKGVPDRIWFAGQQQEMGPWYRTLRVYAHTSRSEGFPKAALEAMAHGLPVVAFRVGGIPEAVAEGETGLLCEPDDLASFARHLAQLLNHPDQARALGEAGRRRVQERFSPGTMAMGMMDLFDQVLEEARRREGAAGAGTTGPAGRFGSARR